MVNGHKNATCEYVSKLRESKVQWLKIQSLILKNFWEQVNGIKFVYTPEASKIKLNLIKEISDIQFFGERTSDLQKRREQFEDAKKRGCDRFKLKGYCLCCGEVAHHRHHIITLKSGGINSKRNIVSLCINCHLFIHPWMKIDYNYKAKDKKLSDKMCPKCHKPLELRGHQSITEKMLSQNYYFTHWYYCEQCRYIKNIESCKVINKK